MKKALAWEQARDEAYDAMRIWVLVCICLKLKNGKLSVIRNDNEMGWRHRIKKA